MAIVFTNWNYTQTPPQSRYPGGTVRGGLVFGPPELGSEGTFAAQNGVTASSVYLVISPAGAALGFGAPDTTSGGITSGYSVVGSGDALLFRRHLTSINGPEIHDGVYFSPNGSISWQPGSEIASRKWGSLTHSNAIDDRVYTFPDFTANVTLNSISGGLFANGYVAFGDADGALTQDADLTFNGTILSATGISVGASGLDLNGNDVTEVDEIGFNDAAADATAAGRIRRNGTAIQYHDGTAARNLFNKVRKNSTGTIFSRSQLNFIEGTNITLTVADDAGTGEIDITITAAGGGAGESAANAVLRYERFY